ncbi:MAG: RluA family pseudouridine synthase [Solobacterium sp.]|nr:RluA family pseudouridine synthase [Solobacterium sp.]
MNISYEKKTGRLSLTLPEETEAMPLTEFLEQLHISRPKRFELFQTHALTLNRTDAAPSDILHARDRLDFRLEAQEVDYAPAEREARVIYEDDFVYIVHKDPGIIVHDPDDPTCLASMAAAYQLSHGISSPVRYIHRLDRETTGLVLFVKIPLLQGWYDAQLEEKNIQRDYLAVTAGKGHAGQKLTYNQKIGRDRHVNGRYRFSSTGKEALTKVTVLDRKKDFLLMRCHLLTGRTHQIRVHLSGNRHPIINDPLYGIPSEKFRNMCLWADTITFSNPFSEEVTSVHDRFNPDFSLFSSAVHRLR